VRGKLAFLIICVGATGCGLLALRQQRLESVNELARVQRQLVSMDQDLYRARVQIAAAITPSRVTDLAITLGPLRPIGVDPVQPWLEDPSMSPSRLTAGDALDAPRAPRLHDEP